MSDKQYGPYVRKPARPKRPMPRNTFEAAQMVILGLAYLREHAPEHELLAKQRTDDKAKETA